MSKQPFGLAENPFSPGHDPRWVYTNRERKGLLALVRQALADGEPFVLVTGDGGTGKTLAVSDALGDETLNVCAVFLAHPTLRRDELLEAICIAFGVEADFESKPQTLASLGQHFAALRAEDRRAVLVMDEAHSLGEDLLEELRLLSNLESDGQPLLQIVLVGLPELERRLARPELAALRQRISVQGQVRPLSAQETERYIHHRVAAAGGDGAKLFSSDTCFEIHRFTYGFPRDINRIASRAMARAKQASAGTVLAEHVRAAVADSRLRSEEPGPGAAAPSAWPAGPPPSASRAAADVEPPAPASAPDPETPPAATAEPAPPEAKVPDPGSLPSGDASQDIDAWVSRFIGDGPPKIGSRAGASATFAEEPVEARPREPAGPGRRRAPRTDDADMPDRMEGPTSAPGLWDSKRLTLAAVAVLVVGIAAVVLPRALRTGEPGTRPEPPPSATASDTGETSTAGVDSVKAAPSSEPSSATPDTSTIIRRYAIRVATYLDLERAEEERERIARTTGLHTRIWGATDGGATVHHIVVGTFDAEVDAEKSADDLLQRGLVQEARVVSYRSHARRSR